MFLFNNKVITLISKHFLFLLFNDKISVTNQEHFLYHILASCIHKRSGSAVAASQRISEVDAETEHLSAALNTVEIKIILIHYLVPEAKIMFYKIPWYIYTHIFFFFFSMLTHNLKNSVKTNSLLDFLFW